MPPYLSRILRTRLMRALMVGFYGQGIQIALQLLGVPIMIAHWGLEHYGVWLALYSVPSYFVMADFGLTTASSNDMAMRMTRGDLDGAKRVFHALRVLVTIVSVTLFTISALVIFDPGSHLLDFAQSATSGRARITALMLITYGLVGLTNGTVNAGFRAVDRFAFGGSLYQTIFLVESSLLLLTVAFGAGLFQAALTIIIIRVGGSALANVVLYTRFGHFAKRDGPVMWRQLRRLLRPALGSMVIPFANATALQGPVLLISSILGAASVPLFTTARTLTRFPLQMAMILSVATVSRFTVVHAAQAESQKAKLAILNIIVTVMLLLPTALLLFIFGLKVILIWTRGRIHTDWTLLALLIVTMLANGCWTMLSNFLVALNHQERFAYAYGASALAAIGIGRVLAPIWGIRGIGVGVLTADSFMFAWVIIQVVRLHILPPAVIRTEAVAAWRKVRGGARNVPFS